MKPKEVDRLMRMRLMRMLINGDDGMTLLL